MKKPAAIISAEAAVTAKAAEVAEAKAMVERLTREHAECVAALRAAWAESDADRPQCRRVRVRWRSEKEEDDGRVAILRRTPGGMLVVRRVGDEAGYEFRFKWVDYGGGKYTQAERYSSFVHDHHELRDVPPEYLPATPKEDTP